MPTTKTAEKEMRASGKRKERNKSSHSRTKTKVVKALESITSGNLKSAEDDVRAAVSALDREAERGKINRNNAARRKSRLIKKLNKAKASTDAKVQK